MRVALDGKVAMAKHGDDSVYFLLVYSVDDGRLVDDPAEFVDREEAIERYDATERLYRGKLNRYEIVLIAADSIETVMTTHGHYFQASNDSMFSEFLADA
ncbi:hypothetical protein Gbro_4347 [Gordonia bronchialis DSM 43247]|uniref:Uncharacterized protein n=1 Tax=Gordonia bronchialis (strain ATCC 25592 / DSM 43247 / BCRC 13721 / JCM 3198 / KCTC 3076 / NBRC 16047 / NCTC 10667) TaxID=526226 RepID=D0L603_GORB4|nr:hypothetical protein [Gordonia bronchialis]ACY23489.1 hypothetical protein Gbro_4347 [Gordonia bronchialis DSM 43247]MCC3321661.1 hypothetical protein [Gordonia bronchialis]QGS23145.1 hypothetical protein FOB84_02060 [Gordonia bronchialis]UAK36561.1 hypothetical protein K8O93_14895 [Gordonia bronchialis]STQ66488.1 Uncharacterised protein [Gordonia bronchialis]